MAASPRHSYRLNLLYKQQLSKLESLPAMSGHLPCPSSTTEPCLWSCLTTQKQRLCHQRIASRVGPIASLGRWHGQGFMTAEENLLGHPALSLPMTGTEANLVKIRAGSESCTACVECAMQLQSMQAYSIACISQLYSMYAHSTDGLPHASGQASAFRSSGTTPASRSGSSASICCLKMRTLRISRPESRLHCGAARKSRGMPDTRHMWTSRNGAT